MKTVKTAKVLILEVIPDTNRTAGIAYAYQYVLPIHEWSSVPRTHVDFFDLDELTAKVRALALSYEKPCSVSVRVDGRKPAGFDRRFGGDIIANFPQEARP